MSSVTKAVKGRTSVLERTKQYESLSHQPEVSTPNEDHSEASNSDDEGLDFAALVKNLTGENHGTSEGDALKEAFKILDYDEDGFISDSDLRTALKMFDDDEEAESEGANGKDPEGNEETEEEYDENEAMIQEMIAEADFDEDGKISFDDFLHVLTKSEETETPEHEEEERQKEKKGKKKPSKRVR